MSCAITQVEIDQRLVGNLGLVRQLPKIGDRTFIEPDRHGALEALRIRVRTGLREVVFFSHGRHFSSYCCCSARVALRAEMSRMTSSFFL